MDDKPIINEKNVGSFVDALNGVYEGTRLKVSVSISNLPDLFPLILDGELIGMYKCYLSSALPVKISEASVTFFGYLNDLPGEKIELTCPFSLFGKKRWEEAIINEVNSIK